MQADIQMPEAIKSQRAFKRKFRFSEMARAFVCLPRAMPKLSENRVSKLVDQKFLERLQLAVTEVNGCSACSYQHTKTALREGMSNEEIVSFLSGATEFITPEEAKGILFAQHFAESRGYPKKYAYDSLVKEYGEPQARIILAAVQIMIAGNMYGIPYSALQSRLKGRPYKNSSLSYELGMLIAGILWLPIALILGFLRGWAGLANERFDYSMVDP